MRYQAALHPDEAAILPCEKRRSGHDGRLFIEASALRVLRLSEQELARLVVVRRGSQVGQHGDAALHRRPRSDLIEPLLQMRIIAEDDALLLPTAQPRKARDVRDRVAAAA